LDLVQKNFQIASLTPSSSSALKLHVAPGTARWEEGARAAN